MSLMRKGLLVSASQVASAVMSVGAGMILSRCLGPEGMGQFDLFRITGVVAMTVAALGVGNANIFFLNNRGVPETEIATTSAKLGGALGLLLAAGFACAVEMLPDFFGRASLTAVILFG